MAVKKTFEFFFAPLLKKFFQDMGRDPNNLEMILLRQKAGQLFKDSNKVINFPQKRSFKEEIEAMKKSGDIVDEDNIIISDKITDREMFKNSNLNKPTIEGQMEKINKASKRIDEIKKEQADMYKPKSDAEIKAKYDKQNKESIQRFKDKMKKEDDEGFYTGGMVDVEPNLSDIGHGSDALMARTRLVSPGSQSTTSTGLNYLLAEDNDNIRVPFAGGKSFSESELLEFNKAIKEKIKKGGRSNMPVIDPEEYKKYLESFKTTKAAEGGRIGFSAGGGGRRAFLKFLASIGGLTAAAKSGMIGLGEGTTKKAVTETIKQSAGSGQPPPYFFKLVDKIKTMGDDVTKKSATQEREVVTKYKDFELTENIATGEKTIQRKKPSDFEYYDEQLYEDVYMNYKPGKGQADEATPKVADEYVEDTSYIRTSGPQKGDIYDTVDGVPDDIFEEIGEKKIISEKADGGRIGYNIGGLSKLGITGSSRRFLEKVFGKEKFKNMIENDPELHRGMLEVVEMFRSKDKSGLVEYMQNFLPQMSKKEIEDFVVGSGDISGIEGQLIRLGSGRDYKGKLDMMKEAENVRKLENFDIDGVSKNADGGRIGFSGGGIFRAIIAKSAAKKGLKPYEFIKVTNYKGLPPEVKMFISPEEYAELKLGQEKLYTNFIDMAKTRKNFQEQVEGGKTTPARELFEGMEKTMDEQSFVPKTVTDKDIAEMELMVKNRFNKGRKDNAEGGLQTMLGE